MPSLQKWILHHLCLGGHRPKESTLIINEANKQTMMNNKMLQLLHPHTDDIPYLYTDALEYEEDLQLLDV
jgi:hypothetical protein